MLQTQIQKTGIQELLLIGGWNRYFVAWAVYYIQQIKVQQVFKSQTFIANCDCIQFCFIGHRNEFN
jgi:hypothetical protein